MYLAISYGLGIFTVLAVLALLWMGWEHKRDEVLAAKAKRAKESRKKFANRDTARCPERPAAMDIGETLIDYSTHTGHGTAAIDDRQPRPSGSVEGPKYAFSFAAIAHQRIHRHSCRVPHLGPNAVLSTFRACRCR